MQIAIASGKGGVGKSSITSSLIYDLSTESKIIGVDADADTPNLHIVFGISKWDWEKPLRDERLAYIDSQKCNGCGECAKNCPYECIHMNEGTYKIDEFICEGCNVCSIVCRYNAIKYRPTIPGYVKGRSLNENTYIVSSMLKAGRANSGKLVFEAKREAKRVKNDAKFDHIIIDSAAGIGCQVIASINGSDLTVMVAEPTPTSLSDAKRLLKVIRHFKIKPAIIINKIDVDEKFAKRIVEFADRNKIQILGTIPYDKSVLKAIANGEPATKIAPESKFSKSMKKIEEELKKLL